MCKEIEELDKVLNVSNEDFTIIIEEQSYNVSTYKKTPPSN